MNFEVHKNGSSTTIKIRERKLDSSVSPELKGEFLILCKPKTDSLIIDLEDVEFCDSSGLSALLIAERKMREVGGKVRLINVHKKVVSLLKISMLDRAFDIEESPEEHARKQ
jgi:anti-anti-sigma factor